MKRILILMLVGVLTACGSSSGDGNTGEGASCVQLSAPVVPSLRTDGASTANELPPLQVTIEVRFLTLSDTFYDSLGLAFDTMLEPDPDGLPTGGSNGNGTSFGTTTSLIGGLSSNSSALVPQGQTGIQILPVIHPNLTSPTPGQFISTNLPGDRCIEFGAGTTQTLNGLNPVPGGQELPPIIGGSSPILMSSLLTDPQFQVVLRAIQSDGTSELLAAPQITVRDGQQATVQATTETPNIVDLPTIWNARFTAMNGAIGQVQTGPVLAVRPVVSADMTRITLKLMPEAQMATVFWPQTFNLGGVVTSGVEVPVLRRRGARTQVTMLDGQTVALGGTLSGDGMSVDRGVPIFGDLPVLGTHTRTHSQLDLRRNLLIFVTARLVNPVAGP